MNGRQDLVEQARRLYEQADYDGARTVAHEAVRQLEDSGADGGRALLLLGRIERRLGDHAAAGTAFRRALGIAEALPDGGGRVVIRAYAFAELAALRRAEGRDADAEPLVRRALAEAERAVEAAHPDGPSLYHSLAAALGQLGTSQEVERPY